MLWCSGCHMSVSRLDNFCSNCGKRQIKVANGYQAPAPEITQERRLELVRESHPEVDEDGG